MKMRFTLTIGFLAIFGLLNAQNTSSLFSIEETDIGTSWTTGGSITATKYTAPSGITQWQWDGVTDNLLLQLRGGELYMIDLVTKDVKWNRTINRNTASVQQQGPYYFLTEKKRNSLLDPETGQVLWSNKIEFYYTDPYLNIGIGYPTQSLSNKLSAVDLGSGKTLWVKKVNREFGWSDVYMLNDSLLLIAVDGIQALNLKNGAEWAYQTATVKKHIGKMIGVNLLGIVVGAFTGVYTYQSQPDVVFDLISNMLIDPAGNVVLASRDQITRVNPRGNIMWSQPLPQRMTSKSSLFLVGSTIHMINRGYAMYNGELARVGDPYIAAFDLNDGNQRYLTPIPEKDKSIRSYQAVGDQLFLITDNQVMTYSLQEGVRVSDWAANLEKGEYLDEFVDRGVYVRRNDSVFMGLGHYFSTHNVLMTTEGRAFVLTDSLDVLMVYEKDDLYHRTIDNHAYTLISRDDSDFILLNNRGDLMGSIEALPNMFLHGDALFFFDEDAFWEVDLAQQQHPLTVWKSIERYLLNYLP